MLKHLKIHIFCKKQPLWSDKMVLTFHTLPVELVYRILDNLDGLTILVACRNVCSRLNAITDTYYRYQVMFDHMINFQSDRLSNLFVSITNTFVDVIISFSTVKKQISWDTDSYQDASRKFSRF